MTAHEGLVRIGRNGFFTQRQAKSGYTHGKTTSRFKEIESRTASSEFESSQGQATPGEDLVDFSRFALQLRVVRRQFRGLARRSSNFRWDDDRRAIQEKRAY